MIRGMAGKVKRKEKNNHELPESLEFVFRAIQVIRGRVFMLI
jgi:hypothetical protein